VFENFFTRKRIPLSGTPSTRRLKNYSAQSGYVYQYFYEGHRPFAGGRATGTTFVFTVSAGRKRWQRVEVQLPDEALRSWEEGSGRTLSGSERYAIAKISLFQAFDERPSPDRMQEPVLVRNADIAGIVETLGL
jgi:hypothetical protein